MQLKGHGQRVLFKNHVTYSLGRKHTKMWAKLYKSNPYKTIKARMNISLPATERGGACMIYFKITKHLEQWGASLRLMGICDSSSWQNKSSAVCQTAQRTWRNAAHGAWCSLQAPKPQADKTQNCQKRTLPQMLPQYLHRWPDTRKK